MYKKSPETIFKITGLATTEEVESRNLTPETSKKGRNNMMKSADKKDETEAKSPSKSPEKPMLATSQS